MGRSCPTPGAASPVREGGLVAYDVQAVRSQFPALVEGLAHFDGPGGTQVPAAVADAVAHVLRSAVSNRHGDFASSARADAIVEGARDAVGDLLAVDPRGVVLGPSMTANTYVLAGALAKTWAPGDEVVVSRLDHDANVRPWVQAAAAAGATVRWADIDEKTCELPIEQYADLLTDRTRLVAVTAASNAVGTRPDVRAIADAAHARGALLHVDGVHATPHGAVDVPALGADFYSCSAYKWYGPHVGITVADPALLETLRPDKLVPSSDDVPDRFERGTSSFEQLAGVAAAVDWIAALGTGATRRERVVDAMSMIEAHELDVFTRLYDGLSARDDVTLLGCPSRRTPTVGFTVDRRTPQQVAKALGDKGICVWAGNYYAVELMRRVGLEDSGGAVRAGVVCYSTTDEVDRLLGAL
ncbi:MAG: cysteine desulfurase-like protein [Frankiaceae bacterium]|nr:cysteine desulfurase-like protein [Frankiaceae bacterium]